MPRSLCALLSAIMLGIAPQAWSQLGLPARAQTSGTSNVPSLTAGWLQVPMDAPGGSTHSSLSKVVLGGPGLVALGLSSTGSSVPAQVLWTSTDGRSWKRIALDPSVFPEDTRIQDIAAGGPGLVAVGTKTTLSRGERPHALVWTSADALTWRRVPDDGVFQGATMEAVTVGGPGLIAVGSELPGAPGATPLTKERAAVWLSSDGNSWKLVPYDAGVFGGAGMVSVTRGGPGLVAVGSSYPAPPAASHAAVWTATDGLTWRRVPHDSRVFPDGTGMDHVVSGPGGLVATGTTGPPNAPGSHSLAWTSADGVQWVPASPDPFDGGQVSDMAAGGPGFVAVGTQEYDPALWSSADGSSWSRNVGSATFAGGLTRVSGVVAIANSLVVAGSAGEPGQKSITATAWVWPVSQIQGTGQSVPSRPALDPKSLRLRLADLPAGYGVGQEAYTTFCGLDNRPDPGSRCRQTRHALGHYSAYSFAFQRIDAGTVGPSFIQGAVIVVQSKTAARAVLTVGGALVRPLGADSPYPHRLPSVKRIGQGTRVYATRALFQGTIRRAYAVVWRDGRVLGAVIVGGERKPKAVQQALLYAGKLHAHLTATGMYLARYDVE